MRSDIQTLRALAVVLVLLWHAGIPGVTGGYIGVDVFFVVSGFLMTSIIVRELVRDGRVNLPVFYLRRARRLLPAALLALLGTALLTVILFPVHRWRDIGGDLAASSVYLVNWRLAERSVDYLADDLATSPLQHYWSLAVEEQFYLGWPVLLAVVTLVLGGLHRGSGPDRRELHPLEHRQRVTHRAALVASLTVLVISLAWSAWLTRVDPGRAYFVTTTRLWELALGGVLAALWPWWTTRHRPPALSAVLVVGGLLAIALSAALYSSTTAFPGVTALLPTVGTAAVLLGGPFLRPGGVLDRALKLRPALWVGGISYSLYLWHWPLLVATREMQGGGALPWRVGLIVVLVSVVPAWLSTRFVEERFRSGTLPTGRRVLVPLTRITLAYGVTAGVCGLALAVLPVLTPLGSITTASGKQVKVTPAPDVARDDVYQAFYDGCPELGPRSPVTRCVGGDPEGDLSIAVVGDSHAVMWMNGLDAIGADRGWRVELMARTSCPAADVVPVGPDGPRTECRGWLTAVHEELASHPPDIVITAHVTIPPLDVDGELVPTGQGDTVMADGLVTTWSKLQATGALVVSLTPTPRFRESRVECLGNHLDEPAACDAPVEEVLPWTQGAVDLARQRMPSVRALDLSDLICPDGTCRAIHNDVLVYSDNNHLTRTWVLRQADEIGRRLAAVVDEAGVRAATPDRPSPRPAPQAGD